MVATPRIQISGSLTRRDTQPSTRVDRPLQVGLNLSSTRVDRPLQVGLNLFIAALMISGPLRKWILPDFSDAIYLLVDLPALYLAAMWYARCPSMRRIPVIILSLCTVFVATLQLMTLSVDPLIVLTGIRGYLFFFICLVGLAHAITFTPIDRLIRILLLWLAVQLPIIALQAISSGSSWINTTGLGPSSSLGLAGDYARASGLFASNAALVHFLAVAFSINLVHYIRVSSRGSLAGVVLAGASLVLTGSRSALLLAVLVLLAAPAVAWDTKEGGRARVRLRLAFMLSILALAIPLTLFSSPQYSQAFEERLISASDTEDTASRIRSDLLGFLTAYYDTPYGYGVGIGATANAANVVDDRSNAWVESDLTKMVVELGPFVGLVAVSMRLLGVLWLFIHIVSQSQWRLLPVFAAIAPMLLVGPLTSQASITAIAALGVAVIRSSR